MTVRANSQDTRNHAVMGWRLVWGRSGSKRASLRMVTDAATQEARQQTVRLEYIGLRMLSSQVLDCLCDLGGFKTIAPNPRAVQPSAIMTQINQTIPVIINTSPVIYRRIDRICRVISHASPTKTRSARGVPLLPL